MVVLTHVDKINMTHICLPTTYFQEAYWQRGSNYKCLYNIDPESTIMSNSDPLGVPLYQSSIVFYFTAKFANKGILISPSSSNPLPRFQRTIFPSFPRTTSDKNIGKHKPWCHNRLRYISICQLCFTKTKYMPDIDKALLRLCHYFLIATKRLHTIV